ncbi:MAG: cation:proton antiporter [Synergistaceae bacterium]|nr:cation:proton antiporter [Synergistaceae bacterium]
MSMIGRAFEQFKSLLQSGSPATVGIITIAIMLLCGFALTRLTKLLKLPNVTAYIVTGILIGPYCWDLVPRAVAENTSFLPDIALAFIAFSTGQFFRFSALKGNGLRVMVITILEACVASLFVFIAAYGFLGMDLAFSAVLAALASATAPASTMMTIRQTGARGDFVNTLLQVVALDDVVGLLAYSIAISVALATLAGQDGQSGGFDPRNIVAPILLNLGSLLLGAALGTFLKLLLPEKRSTDNRLIISVAVLFAFCGMCQIMGVSPLLGCMSMATVYINVTDDDKLFKQLNYFSPPFLLLFFVRSGVCFDLGLLLHSPSAGAGAGASLLTLGVIYFLVRIAGKYVGAFLGCSLTHKSPLVRNYLGLALIPQAGVAIGLAELGARTLGGVTGNSLRTVILASSVLYELIGPGCAKLSLVLSRSIPSEGESVAEEEKAKTKAESKKHGRVHDVNFLIERIREIQAELPEHETIPLNVVEPAEMGRGRAVLQSLRRRFHSNNL